MFKWFTDSGSRNDEDLYRRRFPKQRFFSRATSEEESLCTALVDGVMASPLPVAGLFRHLQSITASINLDRPDLPAQSIPSRRSINRAMQLRSSTPTALKGCKNA